MKSRNDRVIKVKEVMVYYIHHIIFILACLVIGGVGLAGLCYLKNARELEAEQTSAPVKLEDMYENFTSEEKAAVSYALYSYDRVREMEQYIDESVYMKLSPQHVTQTTVQYKVELVNSENYTYEEKLQLINQIIIAYSVFIRDGGLSNQIVEESLLKADYTAEQIGELLEMGYDPEVEAMTSFCLYVYGSDLVSGLDEAAMNALESYMNEGTSLAKHKLVIMNQHTEVLRNDAIYNNQRYMYTERVSSNDRLKNAMKDLSGDTLYYYNEVVSAGESIADEVQTDGEVVASSTDVNNSGTVVPKKKLLKYGILGALVGIIGACGLLLLRYMFSSTIIADTDYTATMGMKLLGKISESDSGETLPFVVAKARLACNKEDISKLALVSSDFSCIGEDIQKQLVQALDKQGIELIAIEDVLKDCDAMNRLFEIGDCLLLEKTGTSRYDKVYDIVELCDENSIGIVGVVDIEK